MKIGYARVSTAEQNLDLQRDALKAAGCEKVITDKASGATAARPGLEKVKELLRAGDTLVVWRLDRLGRSLRDLIGWMTYLDEEKVGLLSLHEAIDLMALAGRVIANDSGLMHVAAALNRPLIGVYGSTSPLYTPPLADRVEIVHTDIECRPCFKRTCKFGHLKCLIELMPEQVIEAGNRLERGETADLTIVRQPVESSAAEPGNS